jgi:hypothetical protein
MALPPLSEGQKVVDEDYKKACPDYKRYSMFMQYASRPLPKPTANFPRSTILRRRDATAIPTALGALSNIHVAAGGEGH